MHDTNDRAAGPALYYIYQRAARAVAGEEWPEHAPQGMGSGIIPIRGRVGSNTAKKEPTAMMTFLITLFFGGLGLFAALAVIANGQTRYEKATFAGGCFWCMEPPFEKLEGVVEVVSGYTGGAGTDPTYSDYAHKGHIEAIQVTYDPSRVSYSTLLDVFWRQVDPTDARGQFVDRGPHYRTAIFYHTDEQKRLAESSKEKLAGSGRYARPVVTEILKATTFYPAEEYHQDFYKTSPDRYKAYRMNSGRDRFLETVWGQEGERKEHKRHAQ